jgi:starch synthase
MNILFPIAELMPLYKIGGLGDVAAALPKSLHLLGTDVRIIIPFHPEITATSGYLKISQFKLYYNQEKLMVKIYQTYLPGTSIPVYLVHESKYISTHSDASDNHADKFAVFSLAVATFITHHSETWQPHVIHCHDWHTALIPLIIKHVLDPATNYKFVLTIHNLAYQGITTTPIAKHLGLPSDLCQILSWDNADGDTNIMLEGLLHVDAITTVSPTYAKEILTSEYGEKIESIMAVKASKLTGILNGLDTIEFNPETDSNLPVKFNASNWLAARIENRHSLRRFLDLNTHKSIPLLGFVGRVDPYQKGIGLMIELIKSGLINKLSAQFVFLGAGDPRLESELHKAGHDQPNIRIITRFDEPLARKIYASSHLMLIPSRFEPCGLVQLIAMRYGALPVARKTGGLVDTIDHQETGFLFDHYQPDDFLASVSQAVNYISNQENYTSMVSRAMAKDFAWTNSANLYQTLYERLTLDKPLHISDKIRS